MLNLHLNVINRQWRAGFILSAKGGSAFGGNLSKVRDQR